MTNPDYTHLLLIADRSGSMSNIADDMNGGITTLLAEQAAEPGTLRVDLWTFDRIVEHIVKAGRATDVPKEVIVPRGSTALNDAVGQAVTELGESFAALSENKRPGKVVVVIVTDGEENSSREWRAEQVRALVEKQQDTYSWQFVFLGANIDSFATAGGYGIGRSGTMDFAASSAGVANAFAASSASLRSYRGGATSSISYDDDDREAAMEE